MKHAAIKPRATNWQKIWWMPYLFLFMVMLVLHLQFTLGTGDDVMNKLMVTDYGLMVRLKEMYERWSARQLVDAVMYLVSALPYWVWRLVDPIVITFCAFLGARLLQIERSPNFAWLLVGLVLSYEWVNLASAGWVCTTLGFIWPLTAGLAALQPYVNYHRGQKTPVWSYPILCVLFLYAVNMEQLLVVVFIMLLVLLVITLVCKQKVFWYLYVQLGLCFASLLYVMTCPGLAIRMETEMSVGFKDFQMRSLLQQIELGLSNGFTELMYEPNYLFFLFCGVVCLCVWQRYQSKFYRAMAALPLVVVTMLGLLVEPLRALLPQLWFFRNALTSTGMITIAYAGTPKRYIAFLLLCTIFSLCIANLYLAFGHSRTAVVGIALLCAGFSSHAMLGFSTSIWTSGARTALFCQITLLVIIIMLCKMHAKPETKSWCAVKAMVLALAAIQCVSLIGA